MRQPKAGRVTECHITRTAVAFIAAACRWTVGVDGQCHTGSYGPSGASCTECPSGTYVDVEGSIEASDCIACAVGLYVGVPGSDEASDCVELACDNVAGAAAAFGSCAAPGKQYHNPADDEPFRFY